MAVKARPWTAADREIARLLTENKEARKWSFRTIEEKSGINYVRVRDISNAVHGTPTVSEFLAICETFGLDPAVTLRKIIARAASNARCAGSAPGTAAASRCSPGATAGISCVPLPRTTRRNGSGGRRKGLACR